MTTDDVRRAHALLRLGAIEKAVRFLPADDVLRLVLSARVDPRTRIKILRLIVRQSDRFTDEDALFVARRFVVDNALGWGRSDRTLLGPVWSDVDKMIDRFTAERGIDLRHPGGERVLQATIDSLPVAQRLFRS